MSQIRGETPPEPLSAGGARQAEVEVASARCHRLFDTYPLALRLPYGQLIRNWSQE